MKQLKPLKKIPYLIISPVLSVIGEVVFIFALFAIMESLSFGYRNMANFLMSLVIGATLWGLYGLAELLLRKAREAKWYIFSIGCYAIPLIFWTVMSLASYTGWYSNRLDEDAEFFMYFTRTMLIYLLVAAVLRVLGHIIFMILSGNGRKSKAKKGN